MENRNYHQQKVNIFNTAKRKTVLCAILALSFSSYVVSEAICDNAQGLFQRDHELGMKDLLLQEGESSNEEVRRSMNVFSATGEVLPDIGTRRQIGGGFWEMYPIIAAETDYYHNGEMIGSEIVSESVLVGPDTRSGESGSLRGPSVLAVESTLLADSGTRLVANHREAGQVIDSDRSNVTRIDADNTGAGVGVGAETATATATGARAWSESALASTSSTPRSESSENSGNSTNISPDTGTSSNTKPLLPEELTVVGPGTAGFACPPVGSRNDNVGECVMTFRSLKDMDEKVCYKKNENICVDGLLCPISHPKRCLDGCYDPSVFTCHDDILCTNSNPLVGMFDGAKVCYSDKFFRPDEKNGLVFTGTKAEDAQLDEAIILNNEISRA